MKATLRFDLPADSDSYRRASAAEPMVRVITAIDELLMLHTENTSEDLMPKAPEIREQLHIELESQGLMWLLDK